MGDYRAPDRHHLALTTELAGISFETELITIGGEDYATDPLTGVWQVSPTPLTGIVNLLSIATLRIELTPEVTGGFILVDEGRLDGEDIYYLRGSITGKALSDVLDDSDVGYGDAQVEYWIGAENFAVRKAEIREIRIEEPAGKDVLNGTADSYVTEATVVLSDFGKPVDIQAPEVGVDVGLGGDDHASLPYAATQLTIGEVAKGTIDSPIDFDYFKFQAGDGFSYRISLTLKTLTASRVTLFNSGGNRLTRSDDFGDSLAPKILWVAPTAGEYYLAVESYDGGIGTYMLTITTGPNDK